MNLTLSDTAYSQIGHLLKEHDKKFVRLQVKGGGCAGFEYQWSFENEKGTDDVVIDDRVLVDQMNELYLTGIEIDYLIETKRDFIHPHTKSTQSSYDWYSQEDVFTNKAELIAQIL